MGHLGWDILINNLVQLVAYPLEGALSLVSGVKIMTALHWAMRLPGKSCRFHVTIAVTVRCISSYIYSLRHGLYIGTGGRMFIAVYMMYIKAIALSYVKDEYILSSEKSG